MPAKRCSYASGGGGGAKRTKLGKNGGTVLGKRTSATMPSSSCCVLRRSLSQLRRRRWSPRSRKGFLYLPRQASKSSRYAGSRYSRYWEWLPPAWQSAEMIVRCSVASVLSRTATPRVADIRECPLSWLEEVLPTGCRTVQGYDKY